MTRRILIVGAGQSGLHLAHGLQSSGDYTVTVMTAQPPEEIRTAPPSITQFSLPTAREAEQRLGLDFYADLAPGLTGAHMELYPPHTPEPLVASGYFGGHAVAVDARHKQADWLEYLDERGAKIVYNGCTESDLSYFTRMYDLVVVATGGAELGQTFPDITADGAGSYPRVVTQVLCEGIDPSPSGPEYVEVISSPLGRILITPILSPYGPATSLCVMDDPGGPLDGSHLRPARGRPEPAAVTAWITETLRKHFPEVAPRVRNAAPIDAHAALVAKVRPHMRAPVAALGGGHVLGLADTVVHTDPLAGQGWSVSSLAADTYLQRIRDHGDQEFTPEWMRETFAASWDNGVDAAHRLSAALHGMWEPDAPAHMAEVLAAATQYPEVANRFMAGFADPSDYDEWLYDPETARAYLDTVTRPPA
ncbi:alanine-phosphoribitol ligase [Streptomonospora sediminis]